MKGVIVAAGKGTRLGAECKALVDVRGKPLVTYPLDVLLRSGIRESIIIQHENKIREKLGDEYKGMKLKYVSQGERKGIAHAISLAETELAGDSMAIILGDIIYGGDMNEMIRVFYSAAEDAKPFDFVAGVLPTENMDEIRNSYGVSRGYSDGTRAQFVEKPKSIEGLLPLLGTGLYVASNRVFDIFRRQKPSARGELEITDALNLGNTYPCIISGKYINLNTPEDFKKA